MFPQSIYIRKKEVKFFLLAICLFRTITTEMKKIPPEIKILPEDVANKIAAGEVIERPAAVVKELLENAIDAGATRIDIEFKHGGKTFIKVSDNGCGMTRAQALMSLQPHATSKIRVPEDIFKISSYGFRGEAVPSIASVSSFSMKTKPESESLGTEICVRSGNVEYVKECGMASGTEIVVENLFCTVPARRKFLKTDNVEASHIIKLCRLFALAMPDLSITLIENSRVLFRSDRNLGMLERIKRIFGVEISEKLVVLPKVSRSAMSVSGAILEPAESFATSRNICAFINSRPVECKAVFSAIKEAYSSYVPKGRFAAAFLFLELPLDSVDVNVHPAKREVRLRDEFAVRDFLLEALSERLNDFLADRVAFDSNRHNQHLEEKSFASASLKPLFSPAQIPEIRSVPISEKERPKIESIAIRPAFKPSVADVADEILQENELSDSDDLQFEDASKNEVFSRKEQKQENSCAQIEGWRYVGCIGKKFAVFETKTGMQLLYISAAIRRIRYARIMENLLGLAPESQLLLIPVNIKFDRADAEVLLENLQMFDSCGFKIEPFGQNFFRVGAVPSWLEFAQVSNFICDFVHTVRDESKTVKAKKLAVEVFACAASSKATSSGFVCSEDTANALLRELFDCPSYASSPDGKPTIKEISNGDFSKMFNLS